MPEIEAGSVNLAEGTSCSQGLCRPSPVGPPISKLLLAGRWKRSREIESDALSVNQSANRAILHAVLLAGFPNLIQKSGRHFTANRLGMTLVDANDKRASRLHAEPQCRHDDGKRK